MKESAAARRALFRFSDVILRNYFWLKSVVFISRLLVNQLDNLR